MEIRPDYRNLLTFEVAEMGLPDAMVDIAANIFDDFSPERSDEEVTLMRKYLNDVAENECLPLKKRAYTQMLLGSSYYFAEDYEEAIKWYELAAQNNNFRAMCYLGYCHLYGNGTPVNYKKAYEFFAKSAYFGYANAMYKLGDMYYYGNHVEKDENAAFFWYSEANLNHTHGLDEADILLRLGRCYHYGHGVMKDNKKALELLSKAEVLFIHMVEAEAPFSRITLPKVTELLENVRKEIYEEL